MGALTLKEAVGLPIESLETAQFRHGPLELAGPDLAAIVIATEPQTRDLDVGLAGELVDAGAAVLLVVEEEEVRSAPSASRSERSTGPSLPRSRSCPRSCWPGSSLCSGVDRRGVPASDQGDDA